MLRLLSPRNYALAALVVAGTFGLYTIATRAQNAAPAGRAAAGKGTEAPTPRMADGHPDFNGFYNGGGGEASTEETPGKNVTNRTADGSVFFDYSGANGGGFAFGGEPPAEANQPPYKPEYMAKVKAVVDKYDYGTTSKLDPQQDCKPLGIPRGATGIMQIVQTPKVMAILYEADPGPYYRVIYTDGRKHPDDLDTSYMGHSIGHWEGDTLVVDVVGLNDETWLGGGFTGAEDYIQPQMCVNNDKPHFIQPTEADHYQCDFCQKNADKVYGEGASADDKARADALDKQYGEVLRQAPGNEGLRRAAPAAPPASAAPADK